MEEHFSSKYLSNSVSFSLELGYNEKEEESTCVLVEESKHMCAMGKFLWEKKLKHFPRQGR